MPPGPVETNPISSTCASIGARAIASPRPEPPTARLVSTARRGWPVILGSSARGLRSGHDAERQARLGQVENCRAGCHALRLWETVHAVDGGADKGDAKSAAAGWAARGAAGSLSRQMRIMSLRDFRLVLRRSVGEHIAQLYSPVVTACRARHKGDATCLARSTASKDSFHGGNR